MKMKLITLIAAAALTAGSTSLMADMGGKCGVGKCGAGKCGAAPVQKPQITFEKRKKLMLQRLSVIEKCVNAAKSPSDLQNCRQRVVRMAKRLKNSGAAATGAKCGAGN